MFWNKPKKLYPTGVNCKKCGKEIMSDSGLWEMLYEPGNERDLREFRALLRECLDCEKKEMTQISQRLNRQDEYKDYLNSDHWKNTRDAALTRAGNQCQNCGETRGLQVHHKTYARRGKEKPGDLQVLCDHCHQKAHGKH